MYCSSTRILLNKSSSCSSIGHIASPSGRGGTILLQQRAPRSCTVFVMTPPNEHTSEGGRDDRGVPYHAECIDPIKCSSAQDYWGGQIHTSRDYLCFRKRSRPPATTYVARVQLGCGGLQYKPPPHTSDLLGRTDSLALLYHVVATSQRSQ